MIQLVTAHVLAECCLYVKEGGKEDSLSDGMSEWMKAIGVNVLAGFVCGCVSIVAVRVKCLVCLSVCFSSYLLMSLQYDVIGATFV